MDNQKNQILQTAMKFFSDKGYYSTSMQYIAKECGISKGSLYKFFPSKEDLFIEVFEHYQNMMFEKATNTDLDKNLTNKERLEQQITIQMEDSIEKKDLIMLRLKEMPYQESEKIQSLSLRTKVKMFNLQKEFLLTAYEDKIKTHIWDAVIIFQGILKEYLFLIVNENKTIYIPKLSKSIVNRMDAIVDSFQSEEPVLTQSMMTEYNKLKMESSPKTKEEILSEVFSELSKEIHDMKRSDDFKKEVLSTQNLLEKELSSKEPRGFLIHALLSYLEKVSELRGYAHHIEKLIKSH